MQNHENEAEIIANAAQKSVIITTSISGRGVDIQLGEKRINTRQRTKQKKREIKSLGGLFVLGTERMESEELIIKLEEELGVKETKETQFFT